MEAPERELATAKSPTVEELHLLIEDMGYEINSYRRREAAWVSLVVHGVIVLAIIFLPKWILRGPHITANTQSKDATFLLLPESKALKPRKSDIISDQNRMAQTRMPMPDKETIRKLLDARRPGLPGQVTPPTPQEAKSAPPTPDAQQPAGGAQPQPPPTQTAQVTSPPQPTGPARNPFALSSPGSAVDQAIQSVAANHGSANPGYGGDHGSPIRPKIDQLGDVEILSDTEGVDFGPYLKRLHVSVQGRWDVLIPQVALPPVMKKGLVVLEFTILKDGTVTGLHVARSSGDESLDRAAYGAINYGPLPQLPEQFKGKYLQLRAYFYYNPERNDFQ